MFKPWHFLVLAAIAIAAFVAVNSGGSSGGWSAVESKIMSETTTADGQHPTKSQAECVVTGLEPLASADEVLENTDASPAQEEAIQQITTSCIEVSSSSEESSGLSSELPESVIGGPACQEELTSSACAEEEQEKLEAAQQEEEEVAEAPLP